MKISNKLIKLLIKESIRKNLKEDAALKLLDPNDPRFKNVADTTFTIPMGLLTAAEVQIPKTPAKNAEGLGLEIPNKLSHPHVDPGGNYYLEITPAAMANGRMPYLGDGPEDTYWQEKGRYFVRVSVDDESNRETVTTTGGKGTFAQAIVGRFIIYKLLEAGYEFGPDDYSIGLISPGLSAKSGKEDVEIKFSSSIAGPKNLPNIPAAILKVEAKYNSAVETGASTMVAAVSPDLTKIYTWSGPDKEYINSDWHKVLKKLNLVTDKPIPTETGYVISPALNLSLKSYPSGEKINVIPPEILTGGTFLAGMQSFIQPQTGAGKVSKQELTRNAIATGLSKNGITIMKDGEEQLSKKVADINTFIKVLQSSFVNSYSAWGFFANEVQATAGLPNLTDDNRLIGTRKWHIDEIRNSWNFALENYKTYLKWAKIEYENNNGIIKLKKNITNPHASMPGGQLEPTSSEMAKKNFIHYIANTGSNSDTDSGKDPVVNGPEIIANKAPDPDLTTTTDTSAINTPTVTNTPPVNTSGAVTVHRKFKLRGVPKEGDMLNTENGLRKIEYIDITNVKDAEGSGYYGAYEIMDEDTNLHYYNSTTLYRISSINLEMIKEHKSIRMSRSQIRNLIRSIL